MLKKKRDDAILIGQKLDELEKQKELTQNYEFVISKKKAESDETNLKLT